MTKIHYTIPEGCTGFTVGQKGSRLIIEFFAEPKRWRAEEGKMYYYVSHWDTVNQTHDFRYDTDNTLYNSGNYYRTREEAEAELKRREAE